MSLVGIAGMAVSSLMRWQLGTYISNQIIVLGDSLRSALQHADRQAILSCCVRARDGLLPPPPQGTFLSTLERYTKNEDGTQNKHLGVWNTETGVELASFSQRAPPPHLPQLRDLIKLFRDIQYVHPNEAYALVMSNCPSLQPERGRAQVTF